MTLKFINLIFNVNSFLDCGLWIDDITTAATDCILSHPLDIINCVLDAIGGASLDSIDCVCVVIEDIGLVYGDDWCC